jgi:hypothetical protein
MTSGIGQTLIMNLKENKMKNLGKLNINSEKLMENDELVSLRGGANDPCGTGFTTVVCTWSPDGIGPESTGNVCVATGSTGRSAICAYYPNAVISHCSDDAQG